jgi:hypothetical protein
MAWVVDSNIVNSDGVVTTLAVPVPTGHVSGDLLVATVTQNTGTGTLSISGWTAIGTQAAENSQRTAMFYKYATSSSEADVPTASTLSALMVSSVVIIRNAHATTPIDASLRENGGITARPRFGSVSSTTNNCLILYTTGVLGLGTQGRLTTENTADFINLLRSHNTVNQTVGYKNQAASGAIDRPYMNSERSSNGGSLWTVAIKDDGNGYMGPQLASTFTSVHRGGYFSHINEYATTSWTALDTLTPTTIASRSVSSTVPTMGTTATDNFDDYGTMTTVNTTSVSGVDATGIWIGGVITKSPVQDMSNKIFSVNFKVNSSSSGQMGSEGVMMVFEDSTGDWAAYTLSKRDGLASGVNYVLTIDLATATPLDSGGTIDWTDIKYVAFAFNKATTSTTSRDLFIKNAVLIDKCALTGGSAASPVTPAFFQRAMHGWDLAGVTTLQGAGQMLSRIPIQVGDGTNKTYFKATGTSYELPLGYTTAITRRFWYLGTNRADYVFYSSSTDTYDFTNTVLKTSTKQQFTIHASSNTSATWDFTGAAFVGWDITGKSGITFNNASFSGNYKMTLGGGGLSGCTVSTSLDSIAVTTTDLGTISNTNFISAGTGHAIEITTAGTYTFEGNTFSGYGADTTANASIYNNSGGLVTINLAEGDTTPTYKNGAGATTTINAFVDNQSVTISGATAGSRIQIYDLTSSTELYNGTPTFPYTWTDGSAYVADREIRLRVAYVSGVTAKLFIDTVIGTSTETTPAVAYQVNQEDDEVYNANAINGSTVSTVTIDDGTMLVEVNTGSISWATLYAYNVYWLFTSAGIVDEGSAIVAVDTANYVLQGFLIKNVTTGPTVPLIITGGYGVDSVTGLSIDTIDTSGGTIFNAPDHVVAYAAGSAVTAGDITDIADAVWDEALSGHATAGTTGKKLTDVPTTIYTVPTAADIADAVLDEALSGHTTAGTVGKVLADIETDVNTVLADADPDYLDTAGGNYIIPL